MPAERPAEFPSTRPWRIVPRKVNDRGDVVYDVFQGDQRRAWGLKDRATAQRWAARLAGTDVTLEEPTEGDETPTIVPRRVWWNEA